ncbi:hypothetical protein AVEN_187562-1 [Araneus ventricosus]|uniref:Uncharacterized protein n=1 Tax=Araneus ventricosus TaxID=182803 RepID=A0A4Y2X300_ARAVE|nr:hypothetical protein AVEN_189766-1 [Araneus ventricosus]GBO43498.1 hypothetical protein AVEN_56182-1 [Araneus ventricosus]GBO43502.1 hypothetical protein AVEN_140783-1 [Araneus ventricosus]GBO43506.1 hypothetical protein AVEN_187562-1 [Araneus ventricosus]
MAKSNTRLTFITSITTFQFHDILTEKVLKIYCSKRPFKWTTAMDLYVSQIPSSEKPPVKRNMGHRLVEFTTQPVRRATPSALLDAFQGGFFWRTAQLVERFRRKRSIPSVNRRGQTPSPNKQRHEKAFGKAPLPTGPVRISYRANKVKRGIVLEFINLNTEN